MREILFRGKSLRSGNWVEGSLLIFPKTKRAKILVYEEADLDFNNVEVDPATVGQYTGLTDKNGKRIFEGDVVKYRDRFFGETVAFITYGDACFCAKCAAFRINEPALDIVMNEGEIEIIGNVTDNPELLKGGEG